MGQRLRGTLTMNLVAREDHLTAFSMIEVEAEVCSRYPSLGKPDHSDEEQVPRLWSER
jgi:hypothetical protein